MAAGGGRRGRGAADNPPNRFEALHVAWEPGEEPPALTRYFRDHPRTVLSRNDSPDVGFDVSLNPYRGCEHGCAYCYARPTHEYLGFSAGLDFETRILVKEEAPELLRRELARSGWRPQPIAIAGVTDAWQPVERRLRLTRRCLEVLAEFRNPVLVVTKSALVARDTDLLAELARHDAAVVLLSIPTLDPELSAALEPRASHPDRRLEAIRTLAAAGVPVGVLVAPVVPGLTDAGIPRVLAACAAVGAAFAGYIVLRLPHGVADLFAAWLERHRPHARAQVLRRIEELRGGRRNDPRFRSRMRGTGPYAGRIHRFFELGCIRASLSRHIPAPSAAAFRKPAGAGWLF